VILRLSNGLKNVDRLDRSLRNAGRDKGAEVEASGSTRVNGSVRQVVRVTSKPEAVLVPRMPGPDTMRDREVAGGTGMF
jgi:hypothetical protein